GSAHLLVRPAAAPSSPSRCVPSLRIASVEATPPIDRRGPPDMLVPPRYCKSARQGPGRWRRAPRRRALPGERREACSMFASSRYPSSPSLESLEDNSKLITQNFIGKADYLAAAPGRSVGYLMPS